MVSEVVVDRTCNTYVRDRSRLLFSLSGDLDSTEVIKLETLAVEELRTEELFFKLRDLGTNVTEVFLPFVLDGVVCPAWSALVNSLSDASRWSRSCTVVVLLRFNPTFVACFLGSFNVLDWTDTVGCGTVGDVGESAHHLASLVGRHSEGSV